MCTYFLYLPMTQPILHKQTISPHIFFLFTVACVALFVSGCTTPNDLPVTPVIPPNVAATQTTPPPTTPDSAPAPTPTPVPAPTPTPKPTAATYKDGTYTAVGKYDSPAGPEIIDVTVTLKGDVITDTTVVGEATNKKSIFMQGQFIDNYKPQVIGKKIQDILLGKISGSSLTPIGFNDALTKIESKAI